MIKKILDKYVGNNYIRKDEVKKHIQTELDRARESEREIQKKYYDNEMEILEDKYKMKMSILEEDLRGEIASMQLHIDKVNEKEKRAKKTFNDAIRETKKNARVTSDVVYFMKHFKDEFMQCFGLVEGAKDEAIRNLEQIEKKENDV